MSIPLRVRHLLSSKKIRLSEFILSQVEMSDEYFFELLDLGSVYVNQKRCLLDTVLHPGDYVRLHTEPKRLPAPNFDLSGCVVAWEKDFVIFNKPQGYPCHALVDNIKENLIFYFEQHFQKKFFLTHRLDIGTGGLWLLALNPEFQRTFNSQLQQQGLEKKYWARVENTWSHGEKELIHYMKDSARAPREVIDAKETGTMECRLIVEKILSPSTDVSDLQINLLTGRTHQIRAQLSHVGHPILGDTMYGSKSDFKIGKLERWVLWSKRLSFETDRKYVFELSEDILQSSLADLISTRHK